jgi:AraC-like DNA-binding protein
LKSAVHTDNRNLLYGKIKRTIFVVVAIIVVISSVFFYQYNLSRLVNQMKQADMQILQSHQEISQTMNRLAYNIAQQILNDPQIAYLLYNTNFNPTELLRSVAQLNNYRNCIPYIESIYIYNDKLESMMVSSSHSGGYDIPVWNAVKDRDLFFDRGIVDILNRKLKGEIRHAPIPRLIEYPESYNASVFCYTFVASTVYGNEPLRETVIVNFSVDWMRQITRENIGSESHTFVVNEEGMLVFSGVDFINQKEIMDISDEPLFQKILEQTDLPKSFFIPFAGEKMLVSVLTADANRWYYIRLTPYRHITNNLLGALALMLAVDVGLILLGLISTSISAKLLYVPFADISNRLNWVEKEKEELREQQTLRNNLLESIDHAAAESATNGGASTEGAGYVLVVRLERHKDVYARDQMMARLIQTAHSAFTGAYKMRSLELDEGMSAALIFEGTIEYSGEYWQNTFLNLRKITQSKFGVVVRGALSQYTHGAGWMTHCYQQAREAMRYRIFPGQSDLILWENVQALSISGYAYPQNKEDLMINQIKQGNADMAKETLHNLMNTSLVYPLIIVQLTVSKLTIALLNAAEDIRKSSFSTLPPVVREWLLAIPSLDEVETLDEVFEHLEKVIERICASLRDRRETKHMELLEYINTMIENSYQNPDCSPIFIAQQTNLSVSYVGRLYKHYMLRSIHEAIMNIRMKHAQQLLTNNRKMTIAQIAKDTGFSSASYFSKAFHREYSMSPNEYRNLAMRDQILPSEK